MEVYPRRLCPHCGNPVAHRAETCLMCGAQLAVQSRRTARLPRADLSLPLLILALVAVVLIWRPWQGRDLAIESVLTPTATATLRPTAKFVVVPTATPLRSPTPTPSPTLPPNSIQHTVESGETVTSIAKKYGTTVAVVLQANGLKEKSLLKVGQTLSIPLLSADTPTPTPTLTPSPTPFVYTVRTADTLSEIAKKFDTTVEALMTANGITDATNLRVGSTIVIVKPPDYSATMAYAIHEVQAGETLISISGKYGVTVAVLKQTNKLTGDKLNVGQKLRIPIGTATPTPTATATTAATPTPAPPYRAPALLAPADGAAFTGGPEEVVLLNWASVGILEGNDWYVLHVQRLGGRGGRPVLIWTRATSWRAGPDLYLAGAAQPQRFSWWVSVVRQRGVDEQGQPLGEEISPKSQVRVFTWQ